MSTVEFSGAVWPKSTRSGAGVNDSCVEVAFVTDVVGVRDSKNRAEDSLAFDATAWRAFAEGLKVGC